MAIPNTTPTPNELFNGEMKKMSDAELRVVLIVTRATFGWIVDATSGLRKEEDWISSSQMIEKSGKSARALNKAIQSCIQNDWIEARTEDGELLDTPEKRMKHGKKIFYRLGPKFLPRITTLANNAGVNPRKKYQGTPANNAEEPPQNLRTTKETLTKETLTKDSSSTEGGSNGEQGTPLAENTANRLAEIFQHYLTESGETKTLFTNGRRDKIKNRLKTFSVEQIKEAITNCFKDRFYSGDNDRGWKANIDYIVRNDEIVERLLYLKPRGKEGGVSYRYGQ